MLSKHRESCCRLQRPFTSSNGKNNRCSSVSEPYGSVEIFLVLHVASPSLAPAGGFFPGWAGSLWDCEGALGNWPCATVPVVSCCLHHICASCVAARLQMMNNFASIQHYSSPRTYAAAAVPPTFLLSSSPLFLSSVNNIL